MTGKTIEALRDCASKIKDLTPTEKNKGIVLLLIRRLKAVRKASMIMYRKDMQFRIR